MNSRMNVEDEGMGLTPYNGEVEQAEATRNRLSEIVSQVDNLHAELDSPKDPKDEDINETEVSQLLIDEVVTTLISSRRKGVNSISKPYKKLFSVPTKSFCDKLDKCLSSSELLPRNVRYYISSGRDSILVLEEEPCVRSISVEAPFESDIENLRVTGKLEQFGYTNFLKDNKSPYRFSLSFPYIVYIIQILPAPQSPSRRLCVFYRNAPLVSLQDSLFKCNLLNIDNKSQCCMGDIELPKDANLVTKVNIILDSFWNSTFNREIKDGYSSYEQNLHLSTFLHWQYYSNKDPMFIMSESLIPAELTVLEAINRMDDEDRNGRKLLNNYKSVVDVLLDEEYMWNESASLYSVTQMPLSRDGIILDSGEEILIDKKKYFVVDFLRNDKLFVTMRVEDEKSEIKDISLTLGVIRALINQIKNKKCIGSITIKDQVVKPGKLIRFNGEQVYTTVVRKIFQDRDGSILTKCGQDYYFLENVDFEVFDEDRIQIRGVKIEKGKRYIIIGSKAEHLPYFYRTEANNAVAYDGFLNTESEDDAVYLKFGNGDVTIPFDSLNNYNIFDEQEIEKLEVARYGQKLLGGCSRVKGNGLFAKNIRSLLPETINKLIQDIIAKQELLIQGFDFDIKFSVGDRVIIPDWLKPETVSQIRTITGFRVGPNSGNIDIISIGDQGETVSIANYLDFRGIGRVNVGSVRKISSEYDGIKAGFKIVAKVKGVQNFMKKDCYEVVGFLTDTGNGIPLMLCSNLCTIWCTKNDLEKFDFFEPSSSKFRRLQTSLAPLTSIYFQPGDLVFSNRSRTRCCEDRILLLLTKPGFSSSLSVLRPDSTDFCKCSEQVLSPMFFYGVPNPRIKLDPRVLTESGDFERVTPYPGFHNTFFDVVGRSYGNAKIYIRREEKNNVSDLFSR